MSESKTQKYFSVSRAILEIIEEGGTNLLTHSLISRRSKVSRAWIYEYMGRDKLDLINVAAEIFGGFFTKTNTSDNIFSKTELKKILLDGQNLTFLKIKDEPVIIKLYFRFRGTNTPIGHTIKKYEKYWLDYISAKLVLIAQLNPNEAMTFARTILTLRLGFAFRIATSQSSKNEMIEAGEALELIHRQIFLNK